MEELVAAIFFAFKQNMGTSTHHFHVLLYLDHYLETLLKDVLYPKHLYPLVDDAEHKRIPDFVSKTLDSDTLTVVVDRLMWLFIPGPEGEETLGSTIQEFQFYRGHPLKKTMNPQELNEFYAEFNMWLLSQTYNKGYSLKSFCRWLGKKLVALRDPRRFGHFEMEDHTKQPQVRAASFRHFLSLSRSASDAGDQSPKKKRRSVRVLL